jgi:hypothetical protein
MGGKHGDVDGVRQLTGMGLKGVEYVPCVDGRRMGGRIAEEWKQFFVGCIGLGWAFA